MKIRVEVDVEPEEMRKVLGLPDVAAIQDEMIQAVRDKISQGADAWETMAAFNKQILPDALHSPTAMQQFLMKSLGSITDFTRAKDSGNEDASATSKSAEKPRASRRKATKAGAPPPKKSS